MGLRSFSSEIPLNPGSFRTPSNYGSPNTGNRDRVGKTAESTGSGSSDFDADCFKLSPTSELRLFRSPSGGDFLAGMFDFASWLLEVFFLLSHEECVKMLAS